MPPTPPEPHTKAQEAFEAIREYYAIRNEPIPQADIKWYHEELVLEKKELEDFWKDCSVTKAYLDGMFKGEDEDTLFITVAKAKIEEKAKPIKESDLGPMPSYGTPEFWAWCHKRKKLRLQKEAEIIAAGGTVPPPKAKAKAKAKKETS